MEVLFSRLYIHVCVYLKLPDCNYSTINDLVHLNIELYYF